MKYVIAIDLTRAEAKALHDYFVGVGVDEGTAEGTLFETLNAALACDSK